MKLKLMLLLFLDNIGSERELMRIVGTRSKHWRTIKRHIHYDEIQRARSQSQSGWAKRDRKRRMHLEGSFADAAANHGFKRARWRGSGPQSI